MNANDFTIRPARFPDEAEIVRSLFREYADGIGVDLAFQDFARELAELPGKYAEPRGRILLAWCGAEPVGCVAMRPFDTGIAEMKRLYVRPSARGAGLGRVLATHICDAASAAGYAKIRLDTLPTMTEARRMYETMGFAAIAPYVFNPVAGTAFLERDLTRR